MNKLNIVEDVLIVAGVTISLVDIQTIMGIILLAVQLSLILFKGGRKLYTAIKNKDADKIQSALEETEEQIKSLTEKDKDGK